MIREINAQIADVTAKQIEVGSRTETNRSPVALALIGLTGTEWSVDPHSAVKQLKGGGVACYSVSEWLRWKIENYALGKDSEPVKILVDNSNMVVGIYDSF